ncbi:MAG: hypothetical protein A2849_03450 [Candidatus Taylorbacteria bacterium RIFCSPHIGHO2_01_FULL_51_15]|uniref:Uncharacterized protein n=1 Tax=Candidatus Taylorbacteria bacterium RIFCSPHIGHO2_01_FULL_51_15 TaxID=1802304 RepID=A0A1G2MA61_9BACT|nr:MAG: hypothetical protein A2849_03450 [Candidatus Taylorbacteria bacterium RIFCSPHIGHO2_01_FULL_51_15]
MPVWQFLNKAHIVPSALARGFITRHKISTVGELLATPTYQEKESVWRALSPLQEEFRLRGFASYRHRFLASSI